MRFDMQRPRLIIRQSPGDRGEELAGPGTNGFSADRQRIRQQLAGESEVRQAERRTTGPRDYETTRKRWHARAQARIRKLDKRVGQ
jgi:hypothetical protein